MSDENALLAQMRAVNAASPFNHWAGFELVSAVDGVAELTMSARPETLQHSGFLHAGVMGALIDTACGFAAASVAGAVLASQYQVRCYRPAKGDRFIARAKVIRAGKRQIFAFAEVSVVGPDGETLVAGGDAVLITAI
jgi:uncharacterized protein (TIGR00369 family)